MKADELGVLVGLWIVFLEFAQDLLEGVKFLPLLVDVFLVDFIRQDHQLLLRGEVDQHDHIFTVQHGTHRIPGVDHGDGPKFGPICKGICGRLIQLLLASLPAFLFVHVVVHNAASHHGECSRVQRILRSWDQHTTTLVLDEGGNGTLHTLRGASGQVDILRLGWIAVTAQQEVGHLLPHQQQARRVGVGPGACSVGRCQVLRRAFLDIIWINACTQKARVRHSCRHLAVEGDRLLTHGMRIANVAKHQAIKG
mmetsp:Transcript_45472/g.99007  ORF Transcript_45472/g.99007 Transcript_45472/m.99007 type:complete len:253 (-) Transcript_45472:237-995(-)